MAIRAHLRIEGRVQGVSFRQSTKDEADRLGVKGWVRNLPDGAVEAVLEGEPEAVEALVAWCHRGPRLAEVLRVVREEQAATGMFSGFDVLFTFHRHT